MWRRLRELGLVRVFGRGPAALVAGSAVNWLIDQARESRQPERLDTARLVPGETYLVTTRPGMNRAERRDSKKLRASSAKLTKQRTPNRKARTTASKLATAQKKVAKATPGSKRAVRNERKVEVLGTRFERLTAPTRQQRKLEVQVAELSARLEAHRATALAKTAKRHHPRTKTFL